MASVILTRCIALNIAAHILLYVAEIPSSELLGNVMLRNDRKGGDVACKSKNWDNEFHFDIVVVS